MIDKEVYLVQNPALGAAILWKFIRGYYEKEQKAVPFPLLFFVLPIIFRNDLCDVISRTQQKSGLSKISEKLFNQKATNEIYTINNVAILLRQLTLKSIQIGIASGLFSIDYKTALVNPISKSKKAMSADINNMLKAAEKLGTWCSEMSINELCKWLKVRF